MSDKRILLDASKILWHKDRIDEWLRGGEDSSYNN